VWFVVDMHHGQRYFFICGCKGTLTKLQRNKPLKPAVRIEIAVRT
jgi:hypothetical protein